MKLPIREIEVIPIHPPLDPHVAIHLYRSNHPVQLTLYRVTLEDGSVGWGEVAGPADDVDHLVGTDAVAGLREITHSGVQMACYDGVGRALEVPAHALMGRQVRQQVPFAYWTNDLPPEIFRAQARKAAQQGFRAYKFKCRPWWDPIEQIAAAAEVVPAGFRFWLDFNGHLREAHLALPILKALSEFPSVGGFESPIPQRDRAGYRELRQAIDRPIAAHFGSGCCHVRSDPGYDRGTPALAQIGERLCDGFVLGGDDVETIRSRAAIADEAKMPFWLQTVGGGLRALWILQLVSTCRAGSWAHLATHNVYADDVVSPPSPHAGLAAVPDGPGFGIEIDEEKVEALRNAEPVASPRRITTVLFPDAGRWHFADEIQRHEFFHFGNLPGFVPGVRTEVWEDDGSPDFDEIFRRAQEAPIHERG